MNNPFLAGERIYLRALEPADVDGPYGKWLNDEEICLNNSHHYFPKSRENLLEYVKTAYTSDDKLPLAIVLKDRDRHIGNISLAKIDYYNRNSDWGIVIGEKDCWKGGYSKEASLLLLKHAFQTLNLLRIHSGTTSENIGGQKLMEAMGMVKEGVRRNAIFKNGKYLDLVEYGVLKDEFLKHHGIK